jgi:hypothetical protein
LIPPEHAAYPPLAQLYRQLCLCLAEFYTSKKSAESQTYLRKSLKVASDIIKRADQPGSVLDARWSGDLFALGYFYFNKDFMPKFSQAKAAFLTGVMLHREYSGDQPDAHYYLSFKWACSVLGRLSEAMGEGTATSDKFFLLEQRIASEKLGSSADSSAEEDQIATLSLSPRALAIPWGSGSDESKLAHMSFALRKSALLMEAYEYGAAKDGLLVLLRKAILTGNEAVEFACQSSLAMLYIKLQDWDTAEKHVTNAMALYPLGEDARARWLATTMFETRIMVLKFALVYIRLRKWDMAIYAFILLIKERQSFGQSRSPPPNLASVFQSADDFLSAGRGFALSGILFLTSNPAYLISGAEFPTLCEDFDSWVPEAIQTAWPDYDLASKNPEDLKIDRSFLGDYSMGRDPSVFQLEETLLRYQKADMDDASPEIQSATETLQRAIDEVVGIERVKRKDSTLNKVITNTQESTDDETIPLAVALATCQTSFAETASLFKLDITPIIGWDRLYWTVRDWVEKRTPLQRNGAQSRAIASLFESIYDSGDSKVGHPSNDAFAQAINLLSSDNEDVDEDILSQILDLLAPGFASDTELTSSSG